MRIQMTRRRTTLKYLALFFLTVMLTVLLVPLIFLLELYMAPYFPTRLQTSIEIGLGDALTMASVLGAVGVFVLERYWSERRLEEDKRYSGALRLMLKQVREQDKPATIEELWQVFREDTKGRELYCEGALGDISLDEFTAQIYALRLEGQVDITYGGQVVPRTAFRMKAKRLGETDKGRVIEVLQELAATADSGFVRASAIEALADMKDASVVQVVQKYLNDADPDVRLAAARALVELVAFPEE